MLSSPYPGPETNTRRESNNRNVDTKLMGLFLMGSDWLLRGAAPLKEWETKPKGAMEQTGQKVCVRYAYGDPPPKLLGITWPWCS